VKIFCNGRSWKVLTSCDNSFKTKQFKKRRLADGHRNFGARTAFLISIEGDTHVPEVFTGGRESDTYRVL